ncbi:hypothetical protein VE04_10233, partial [Pseudogymnoascus sp. 24MN13]
MPPGGAAAALCWATAPSRCFASHAGGRGGDSKGSVVENTSHTRSRTDTEWYDDDDSCVPASASTASVPALDETRLSSYVYM